MGVGIITFTNQHNGRFYPFIIWFITDILSMWNYIDIFFTAQEIRKLFMNISTSIKTCVHNNSFFADISAKSLQIRF